MCRYLLPFGILSALTCPAMAQDRGPYIGVEGGISFLPSTDYNVSATRVQTVPTGSGLLGQTVTTTNTMYGNGFNADYKPALDADVVAGYDFGVLRFEGELGYKRTKVRNLSVNSFLLNDANTAPISGVAAGGFAFGSRTSVFSGMINALLSYHITPKIRIYGGGGGGRARVETLGDRNNVWAYQALAGVAIPVANNVELGVKYRYFQTDRLHLNGSASFTDVKTGATSVSQFSDSGRFRSNSILVSLVYSFGKNGLQ